MVCLIVESSAATLPPANPIVPQPIVVVSPRNEVYFSTEVQLAVTTITTYADGEFIAFSYSLDGKESFSISGNTTLTGLPYGSHTIVVYASTQRGSTYASSPVHFHIVFHTLWTAVTVVLLAIALAATILYFKRRSQVNSAMKRKKARTFWIGLVVFSVSSFFTFAIILYGLDFAFFTTHSDLAINVSYVFLPFLLVLMASGVYWMRLSIKKKTNTHEHTSN